MRRVASSSSSSPNSNNNNNNSSICRSDCYEQLLQFAFQLLCKKESAERCEKRFVEILENNDKEEAWETLRSILTVCFQDNSMHRNFFLDFLKSTTGFICNFSIKKDEQSNVIEIDSKYEDHFFILKFINMCIENCNAFLSETRYRSLFTVKCIFLKLIENNSTIQPKLAEKFFSVMCDRCLDKHIQTKLLAIETASMIQDKSDKDCPIWQMYKYLLFTEAKKSVQCTILRTTKATKYNLEILVNFTKHKDPDVLLAALDTLANKVNPKVLSREQRLLVLTQTIYSKNKKIQNFTLSKLMPYWYSAYHSNLSQFLQAIDLINAPELARNVLAYVFELHPKTLIDTEFENWQTDFDITKADLTCENSFILQYLLVDASESANGALYSKIMPDCEQLSDLISKSFNHLFDLNNSANTEGKRNAQFILHNILSIFHYYISKNVKNNAFNVTQIKKFIVAIIMDYPIIDERLIEILVAINHQLHGSDDVLTFNLSVSQIISNLLSAGRSDTKLSEISANQQASDNSPLSIEGKDPGLIIKTTMYLYNSLSILQNQINWSDAINGMFYSIVLPSFECEIDIVRKCAMESLYIYSCRYPTIMLESIQIYFQALLLDISSVKQLALRCIFNLRIRYGNSIFKQVELSQDSQLQLCTKQIQFLKHQNAKMSQDSELLDNEDRIDRFIFSYIHSIDRSLQFTACSGLTKLFFAEKFEHPDIISDIILIIFDCNSRADNQTPKMHSEDGITQTEHEQNLYQCLLDFLKLYSLIGLSSKVKIAQSILHIFNSLTALDNYSVLLEKGIIGRIAKFLASLTAHYEDQQQQSLDTSQNNNNAAAASAQSDTETDMNFNREEHFIATDNMAQQAQIEMQRLGDAQPLATDYHQTPHGIMCRFCIEKMSEDLLIDNMHFLPEVLNCIEFTTKEVELVELFSKIDYFIAGVKDIDVRVSLRKVLARLCRHAKYMNFKTIPELYPRNLSQKSSQSEKTEGEENEQSTAA